MKEQTREEPRILAAAERQMQAWALNQEIADRSIRTQEVRDLDAKVQAYVAISREEGAGGSEIAQLVGRRLGWEVLDKNLVDRVAQRFHLSRPMLQMVDERRFNWVYDVLGTWMDRKIIPAEKYVTHLCHVVLAAARQANLVLVGRGAQFLLPRDKGLAVRIVAPQEYRVEQVVSSQGISQADARRFVEQRDRDRREFVQRYFHRDIDDPHLYDLVINVERFGVAGTAEQIASARGG